MIPLRLRLSGFLSYRDPAEVDFTTFDLACISGHNGAGKSSLLDAITWALFGQARKRDESLVNLQSKAAEVVFTFEYEGNIYRVLRSLPRGKTTSLEFQIQQAAVGDQPPEWRPLTERTSRETQARIEQVLRLDYDTFINAAFFLQGKADQFTQQTPGRRKEILGSILGLEIWETYRQRAAEQRKNVEGDLASIDGRLQEIEAELSEEAERKARLAALETELARLIAVRQTQQAALESLRKAAASQAAAEKARLEEERRGLAEQARAVDGQRAALADLTAQREKAQKTLAAAEEKIARRGEVEAARNAGREQFAHLKAENDLLKTQMDELKERIERLEAAGGAACPLCGQPLSEEHRRTTLEKLNAEGREKGDRFRANKAVLDDLTRQIADYDRQMAAFEAAERERLAASSALAQLSERLESAQKTVEAWEAGGAKRLAEIESLLAGQEYARQEQASADEVRRAEQTLLDLQEQENRLNQEVGAARQKVNVLDDLRARRKRLEAEREELARQIGRYKLLERAFGKDGVPALLIEQALPEIEARANELLDRLSDGSMSVRFVTQAGYKDKKRDDLRETLEIQISDGTGQRDYELFSGGEAFRVNFAIRLALSQVLAARKGARLQTLVIDEGFGSQDVQGRQRLIEAINAVRTDFAKILVITHIDELKDAFPTRIEVEKTDRGSQVRVIG
ncbi:MAG: SMC family ATPase [Anaerolineales bacterium]